MQPVQQGLPFGNHRGHGNHRIGIHVGEVPAPCLHHVRVFGDEGAAEHVLHDGFYRGGMDADLAGDRAQQPRRLALVEGLAVGAGIHQHQPVEAFGMIEGKLEGGHAPHAEAPDNRPVDLEAIKDLEVGGGQGLEGQWRGRDRALSMSGKIEGDHVVSFRKLRHDVIEHAAGTEHAVAEKDGGALAGLFDVMSSPRARRTVDSVIIIFGLREVGVHPAVFEDHVAEEIVGEEIREQVVSALVADGNDELVAELLGLDVVCLGKGQANTQHVLLALFLVTW